MSFSLSSRGDRDDIGFPKLERWRDAGVLPRTVVDRHNGHGSTSILDVPAAQIADQAEAVSARTWPGRSLKETAVALAADGCWTSDVALCAGYVRNLANVDALLGQMLSLALTAWTGPGRGRRWRSPKRSPTG